MGSNDFPVVPGNLHGPERGIFTDTRARARNLLHPESPAAPRETEDGLGSPDGFRPKSGRKREAGGVTGPVSFVRMKKRGPGGLRGGMSGDALRAIGRERFAPS
jgi:hypothetical protein